MIITLNSLFNRFFISVLFSFSPGFVCLFVLLIPSFAMHSYVSSFCLIIFCDYFYVRQVGYIFQPWRSGLIQNTSYGAQQHTPLWSPELYVMGCLLRGLCQPFCCGGAEYCGHTGRWGWPLAQLAVRPCLMWWLPAHLWLWELQGPRASAGQWWAVPCPSTAGCRPGGAWGWCQPAGGQVSAWR